MFGKPFNFKGITSKPTEYGLTTSSFTYDPSIDWGQADYYGSPDFRSIYDYLKLTPMGAQAAVNLLTQKGIKIPAKDDGGYTFMADGTLPPPWVYEPITGKHGGITYVDLANGLRFYVGYRTMPLFTGDYSGVDLYATDPKVKAAQQQAEAWKADGISLSQRLKQIETAMRDDAAALEAKIGAISDQYDDDIITADDAIRQLNALKTNNNYSLTSAEIVARTQLAYPQNQINLMVETRVNTGSQAGDAVARVIAAFEADDQYLVNGYYRAYVAVLNAATDYAALAEAQTLLNTALADISSEIQSIQLSLLSDEEMEAKVHVAAYYLMNAIVSAAVIDRPSLFSILDAARVKITNGTITLPDPDPDNYYFPLAVQRVLTQSGLSDPTSKNNVFQSEEALTACAQYVELKNNVDTIHARAEAELNLSLNIANAINGNVDSEESLDAIMALYWLRDNDPDSLQKIMDANPDYVNELNSGINTPLNGIDAPPFALSGLRRSMVHANANYFNFRENKPRAALGGIGKWVKKQVQKLGALSLFVPGLNLVYAAQKVQVFWKAFEQEVKKLSLKDAWKLVLFGGFYLAKAVTKATVATAMDVAHDTTRAIKLINRYVNPLMWAYYAVVPESTRDRISAWGKRHRKAIKIVAILAVAIVTMQIANPAVWAEMVDAAYFWTDVGIQFMADKLAELGIKELSIAGLKKEAFDAGKAKLKKEVEGKLREVGRDGVRKLMGLDKPTAGEVASEILDMTNTPPVGLPLELPTVSAGINWKVLLPLVGSVAMVMSN